MFSQFNQPHLLPWLVNHENLCLAKTTNKACKSDIEARDL